MLSVTDDACQAIEGILEHSPEVTGVRIAATPDENSDQAQLALTLVGEPEPSDQVIESPGGPVYVEETTAELLDDKTLDATVDEQAVQFQILPQAA